MIPSGPEMERSPFSPWLFGLSVVALVWSAVLLFAGGFTTSIGAGMAFLDWPLSNGSLNPEGWTEKPDQLAEHSHRLAGMIIGLLALAIAIAYGKMDPRRGVRRLAYVLLAVVVVQGVLGGLRVLLDPLNTGAEEPIVARSFAVAHAMGAQAVVVILATLAAWSAPGWTRTGDRSAGGGVRSLGMTSFVLLVVAILVGAVMRHTGTALAIQTFPAASPDGSWIPTGDNFGVWVHFLHRTIGILGGLGIAAYAVGVLARPGWHRNARILAGASVLLVGLQIWLGLLILETLRNPHVATLHMLNGAALVATVWSSLCWSRKSHAEHVARGASPVRETTAPGDPVA
jgi:cytochrome c oxidase assembly protein subunit 15